MTWGSARRPSPVAEGVCRPAPVRALHLSFVSPEVQAVQWCQRVLFAAALGSLAGAFWWGWESQGLKEEAQRYEAATKRAMTQNQLAATQLQRDGLVFTADELAAIQNDVTFANQLADKRSFSWTRLLSDLEEAVPRPVSIASIKVNTEESAVVIEGVAEQLHDLDRFIHQLQQHRAFRQAVLSKHEIRQEGTGREAGAVMTGASTEGPASRRFVEYTLSVFYRPTL